MPPLAYAVTPLFGSLVTVGPSIEVDVDFGLQTLACRPTAKGHQSRLTMYVLKFRTTATADPFNAGLLCL